MGFLDKKKYKQTNMITPDKVINPSKFLIDLCLKKGINLTRITRKIEKPTTAITPNEKDNPRLITKEMKRSRSLLFCPLFFKFFQK